VEAPVAGPVFIAKNKIKIANFSQPTGFHLVGLHDNNGNSVLVTGYIVLKSGKLSNVTFQLQAGRAIDQEPNEDDFVRLLAMHSSKLMSFIRIITLNHHDDAEEIFQLTCLVLWQKFSQFDRSGNFSAWACRIAHYELLKLRESKRRIKLLSDDAIDALAIAALPISAEMNERRTALSQCLRKLPTADHDLIRQRYFDGLSVSEIADRVNRSTHAIYRELSRVHGLLSRCVQRSVNEGTQ